MDVLIQCCFVSFQLPVGEVRLYQVDTTHEGRRTITPLGYELSIGRDQDKLDIMHQVLKRFQPSIITNPENDQIIVGIALADLTTEAATQKAKELVVMARDIAQLPKWPIVAVRCTQLPSEPGPLHPLTESLIAFMQEHPSGPDQSSEQN